MGHFWGTQQMRDSGNDLACKAVMYEFNVGDNCNGKLRRKDPGTGNKRIEIIFFGSRR